jgi:uncharacterized protein YutE (UPF0331/DUF86 family)
MPPTLDETQVADMYRGQGYAVTVRPTPDQLPPFAADFRVELLARRGAQGALVAVRKTRDELADGQVARYAEVTAAQPGWRFDLAVLEGENPSARELRDAVEFSGEEISRSLEQAGDLNRLGYPDSALVAAWAALEAAMRIRLRASGRQAGWGSKPREMVKELYSAGLLSPHEFRQVEAASTLRNQVVHGFTPPGGTPGRSEGVLIHLLGDITRRLVGESQPAKQSA